MGKTIYFHVGMGKCGTTSLQEFCFRNRSELLSRFGIFYPHTGHMSRNVEDEFGVINNHSHLFGQFSMRRFYDAYSAMGEADVIFRGNDYDIEIWKKLADEVNAHADCDILISAEGTGVPFMNDVSKPNFLDVWKQQLKPLFPHHAMKVVYYIRRGDDYLKSAYNHECRDGIRNLAGYTKTSASVMDYAFRLDLSKNILRKHDFDNLRYYADALAKEDFIVCFFDKTTLKNGDIVIDFFDRVFNVDVSDLPRTKENVQASYDSLWLLKLLYTLEPDMQEVTARDLYNRIHRSFDAKDNPARLKVLVEGLRRDIDEIETLAPGYKALFAERDLSLELPELSADPQAALSFGLLFSLHSRLADAHYCDLHNQIVGAAEENDGTPFLFPTPWPAMNRLALHKTASGRYCFKPEIEKRVTDRKVFGTAAQKAELFLLEAILGALGMQNTEICAFERAFHDGRGKTLKQRIAGHGFKVGYLPFPIQVKLTLPGQFLLGHLSHAALQEIPLGNRPVLVVRDLRHALLSFALYQEIREYRDPGAVASISTRVFSGPGFDNFILMIKESLRVIASTHVVRFEELVSGDRKRMSTSLAALAAVTGCTEDSVYIAVSKALDSPTMVEVRRMIADDGLWSEELERTFKGFNMDEMNMRLGYA